MLEYRRDETLFFQPSPLQFPPHHQIKIIYAYPNEYSVGICSLGYQIVWATLATLPEVQVTRLFSDAMEPLPSDPHILGFSLSWELDYKGIFAHLRFLDIPIRSADRHEHHPIVFGGGPVLTANPEPFADFFDIILLGDGEDLIPNFIQAFSQHRHCSRAQLLEHLSQTPGIYVPALYRVQYHSATGPLKSITPSHLTQQPRLNIPTTVQKATYRGNTLATSTVVTPRCAWENIFMIEAVRSCPEMCAFCLASYVTLPFRAASVHDSLLPAIDRAVSATNRIGLLGASVTQHPHFTELLQALQSPKYDGVRVSLSSVRTNTITEELCRTLVQRGSKSVTVAVESGSQRLREIINKKLDNDDIIHAAIRAGAGGLSSMKLYGMAGVPGEIEEDHDETIAMFRQLKKAAPSLRFTFGCSTFVPKAHTPFQWFGCDKSAEKSMKRIGKELGKMGIEFRPESHKWSVVQSIISRGDRRISRILELVSEYGDSLGSFRRAFKELKGEVPPLEYYAFEDWPIDAVVPWDHIRTSISPSRIMDARRESELQFRPNSAAYSRTRLL